MCVGGSDLDSHLGKRKEASGHLRYVVNSSGMKSGRLAWAKLVGEYGVFPVDFGGVEGWV